MEWCCSGKGNGMSQPVEVPEVDVGPALERLKDEIRRGRAVGLGSTAGTASPQAGRGGGRAERRPRHGLRQSHLPIAWPQWPPGIRAKVAAALQKLARRSLRWYINPSSSSRTVQCGGTPGAGRHVTQAGDTGDTRGELAALGAELRAAWKTSSSRFRKSSTPAPAARNRP